MKAAILSIGDELVLGQTLDTNSAFLSRELAAIGCDTAFHVTVGDDRAAIAQLIRMLAPLADVIIITGGLGPTADDLTREALSDVLQTPLERSVAWEKQLETYFAKLGRTMPERNRVQAMLPGGSKIIWNPVGTACGIEATLPRDGATVIIYAVPGVPKEMKALFAGHIGPAIARSAGGAVILSSTLHTFGLGESTIAERLGDLMDRDRNPSVGTTVSAGVVSLRVNARFPSRAQAQAELEKTTGACVAALDHIIYGRNDEPLAAVVGELLRARDFTLATAESCTGGLLAKMLTDMPGSSAYFQQGWVTYANDAKTGALDVDPQLIAADGAVSESVATAMALGARVRSGADFTLAITGVAGPEGGTDAKPVGTVWIAMASPASGTRDANQSNVHARKFMFTGDRDMIRDRAAKTALALLRFHLLGHPIPF